MAQPLCKDEHYTYADYLTWNDNERYELIDGELYMMSPAPVWEHQSVSMSISGQLYDFLRDKPCKVFTAPFDVRLNADTGDDTVLQPDIVVICDPSKLGGTGCIGAPDMVVEILSPSTAGRDRIVKFQQYLKAGVREYWIVDMDTKTVSVNVLKNGQYVVNKYGEADTVPVHALNGCTISLPDVFVI